MEKVTRLNQVVERLEEEEVLVEQTMRGTSLGRDSKRCQPSSCPLLILLQEILAAWSCWRSLC